MAVFVKTAETFLIGAAWTGTAPGDPGTQTISGTVTSATNLSAFMSTAVGVNYATDQVEFTNMASGGFKAFLPGLSEAGELTIPLHADMTATTGLHALLTAIFTSMVRPTTPAYIDVKATAASRGTSNASFVLAANLSGYTPLSGDVGGKAIGEIRLRPTGAFAILTS